MKLLPGGGLEVEDASPEVIALMKEYNCTFYPNSILEAFMNYGKAWPKAMHIAHIILGHSLRMGKAKGTFSDELLPLLAGVSQKTLLKYLNKFSEDNLILIDQVPEHPYMIRVGFNPEIFGPLFPNYEEAVKTIRKTP